MTDLTTVSDHPAAVIARTHFSHLPEQQVAASPMTAEDNVFSQTLRAYEREHGVTFAALDNDALAAVRKAYAAYSDSGTSKQPLAEAVRDLLGLDDQ